MSLKDFIVLNKLGQGAYSSVYRVERLLDKTQYALKKVKLNNLSQKQQQNALNQVRILASINNKNIIAYKEAFIENNSLCIIMQFANGGDLYQKISDYKKQGIKFQQKQIWNVLIQITRGLRILHSLNIFHRDLKSANVFLTKQGISKLGDMNVSKISKNGLLYTQTGTPYYASPQVWKDKPYDTKSDIWSLGCVIYQMTTLKPPFRAQDMQGLYKKVLKGVFSKISTNYSLELWNVIKLLLQLNPELRPSSQMLLECKTIKQKIRQLEIQEQSINNTNDKQLLKTIRMPHKLHYLTDRLPKPNYTSFKKQHIKTEVNNHPESDFLRIANIINGKRYKQSFLSNGSSQNRYIYNSVEQKKYQNSIPFKHSIKKANNQKNYHKNSLKVVHKSINKQIYLPPIK